MKTLTRENFLLRDNDDSNKILIFGKQENLLKFSELNITYVDSTFSTCASLFHHLFTINGFLDGQQLQQILHHHEELQNSDLTLQPSAVMADFELALIQASCIVSDNYMLSLDILIQIQNVLDIMSIRHYGIRPCGKAL